MRLLLDSHVLLWWLRDDRRLEPGHRRALEEGATQVFVSAASVWELEIKIAIGRLAIEADLVESIGLAGFAALPIDADHARAAARLPLHHRDPFDRMLVAQALAEDLTLVTADPALERYGVRIL